ncbi:DegT/DnrJ/EryC1/StrS family aminotransferase [Clostridium sp. ZBS13]|uniref:DegT/DnrJ/EryC1/StrS family aminotransferase n=1 Tax=Clostridium sp. ZBS13 TaxID=2949971 RepID=UPI00207A32C4|nr:DegT/DnrJ/EryC1/StrS family aminotransferase [Clostridium sp. ZBS13]
MIKLAVPEVGDEELDEIRKVFESKYLVHGDKVEEFEELIKGYLNVKNAIAVSSGTAALHLSLLAIGIETGDEVIIPDFTFPATANVVECVGATTKFVDIDLDSLCINTNKIEAQITSKTKAIIPVHEFGQSADMNSIIAISKKYDLKIIEDAACALGTEYKGQKVGTIGDFGCFSLHPRKAITTGEGGIVVTNDDELAKKIKILRNHGLSYANGKPEFVAAGLNYRMTNIQGAIGVVQMKKLDNINNKRRHIVEEYNKLLKDIKKIQLPEEKSYGKHIWQTYHILLDEKIDRDKLIIFMKEQGIETNFGAYSVHDELYYKKKYSINNNDMNNSVCAHKFGIALPLHSDLKKEDIKYVCESIRVFLGEN